MTDQPRYEHTAASDRAADSVVPTTGGTVRIGRRRVIRPAPPSGSDEGVLGSPETPEEWSQASRHDWEDPPRTSDDVEPADIDSELEASDAGVVFGAGQSWEEWLRSERPPHWD